MESVSCDNATEYRVLSPCRLLAFLMLMRADLGFIPNFLPWAGRRTQPAVPRGTVQAMARMVTLKTKPATQTSERSVPRFIR
jgi:hypothetical protein